MRARFLPLLLVALLGLPREAPAERTANWRVYRMADGMADVSCASVSFSGQGKVLVRHFGPFATELDGYTLRSFPCPVPGNGRLAASSGGQAWILDPEGVREYKDGDWLLHPVQQIASAFKAGGLEIVETIPTTRLYPIRRNFVLVLLPDALLAVNLDSLEHPLSEVLRTTQQLNLGRFSSLAAARDGGLWVACEHGLAKASAPVRDIRPEAQWAGFPIAQALGVRGLEEPREDADGTVTAVAEAIPDRQRVICRLSGRQWSVQKAGVEKIRQTWRGGDGRSWACTARTLFEGEPRTGRLMEDDEIASRQYCDVAVEPGGAFWLATADGLFRYAPLAWRPLAGAQELTSLAHAFAADPQGQVWFVSGSALHVVTEEEVGANENKTAAPVSEHESHIGPSQRSADGGRRDACLTFPFPSGSSMGSLQVAGLFWLKTGALLLACEGGSNREEAGQRLFEFDPASNTYRELNPPQFPNSPSFQSSNVPSCRVLGSFNDGSVCVQQRLEASSYLLGKWDGTNTEALSPLPAGCLGHGLYCLFAHRNGDLWLSGDLGTAWFHDKQWRSFPSAHNTGPEGPVSFAELGEGRIWCAAGEEIWGFDGRSWSGLHHATDRINRLVRGRDGTVWAASNGGVLRFCEGAWIENGTEEGLPAATVRDLIEDARGRLWAGTTRGLSRYYPQSDPDPPRTVIQKLNSDALLEGATVTLNVSGQDKWKYTPREKLLYSYRLDDRDWTPFREGTSLSFSDLPVGKHYFQVRAMDRNCNIEPKAAQLEFAIVLPWYKEARLVVIAGAGAVAALFFAGIAFNRHRRLRRSYAEVERKVAERTHELELANRELLHSQKMTALGTLAAGIAHDFNNILSIIKGSVQIIEENLGQPPEPAADDSRLPRQAPRPPTQLPLKTPSSAPAPLAKVQIRLDRIKTVVEQGSGIVKAMLGFSRDSTGEPTALCDVNAVVEDTTRLLGDRFLRETEVNFSPAPDLSKARGSKDLIQQILLNFIFNAAEAMERVRLPNPQGVRQDLGSDISVEPVAERRNRVIIAARAQEGLPQETVLAPQPAAAYVSISVQDFGCGIAPEDRARVFEPFFTTKGFSSRRGTGLGLSMAYEFAKKMGAGLAFVSSVGQGSTFTLILPADGVARK